MDKELKDKKSVSDIEGVDQNPEKDKSHWGIDETELLKQIDQEYTIAYEAMKPKIEEWILRLKLINNQRRDKKAIGDPLMFTVLMTVLAAITTDRLDVQFMGVETGDDDQAENLSYIAIYDYDALELDIFNYLWNWNAGFFGRALILMTDFDTENKIPIPELVNMLTWVRDPEAKSVNGDARRRGAMRFGGREISLTKNEMKEAGVYYGYEDLKPSTSNDTKSLHDNALKSEIESSGRADTTVQKSITIGDNASVKVLEWFTHHNGKKVIVATSNDRKKIIRYTEIKEKVGKTERPARRWPIQDRTIYPMPFSWDGVSIPDLTEDKQRARSVLQNLSLKRAKIDTYPMYVYDTNKITSRSKLNYQFGKHIGVAGSPVNVVAPIERGTVKNEVQWVLDFLDIASQRATAASQQQNGIVGNEKRTATELNMVENKADKRYSLSAMIFGNSDKGFWKLWYQNYNMYFDDVFEKFVRISGASGDTFKRFSRDNFIMNNQDPDIRIVSRAISEQEKFNKLQKVRAYISDVLKIDKSANYRAALKLEGKLSGLSKDEVDMILPKNYDEYKASDENLQMNSDDGKAIEVDVTDDDLTHIEVHKKALDGKAKEAHIKAHKRALLLKKRNEKFQTKRDMNTPEDQEAIGKMMHDGPEGQTVIS